MSTPFSPTTGLVIRSNVPNSQPTYHQPTNLTSSIATTTLGSSDPGTANVSIGGYFTSSLTTSGYSDYVVVQLQTTTAAAAGDTSLVTFTLSYVEV